MSVLAVGEAVPSRIAGIFRYLLTCRGGQEKRARLEKILSPPRLLERESGGGEMIRKVINECNKMGLTTETGDKQQDKQISLSQATLELHPTGRFDPIRFRLLLSHLIMDPENAENHDLCKLLAWFLAQDVYTITGDQEGLEAVLRKQVGDNRLGLINDARYGDLLRWSVFLGLAWPLKLPGQKNSQLIPDPTSHVESLLPSLFANAKSKRTQLPQFVGDLVRLCPVLDNGIFYDMIRHFLPDRNPEHLSSALSLALLRLQEQHIIELVNVPDEAGKVVKDGPRVSRRSAWSTPPA